jgi:hypothetical protein
MKYLLGVGMAALLQAAISFAIILASRGDGSFVGLGAMLMAVLGIPVTALVNGLLIHAGRSTPGSPWALRVVLVSSILPAAQLALMLLVLVFRL